MGSGAVLTADSLTVLFDQHARALFGYCARRVGPDVAEDIMASTFLVAYERRSRYDPARADALPWLYGIATNLLRRHRRDELRAYRALARSGVDPLTVDGARSGLWSDVNGGIVLMIRRTDGSEQFVVPDPSNPKDNHEAQVAEQRQRFAEAGPNLHQPTPEFLAALPTDPEALRALPSLSSTAS